MSSCTLFLVSFRQIARERAHFAIFVPIDDGGERGTLIHVVGTPVSGFTLQFERNWRPSMTNRHFERVELGAVLVTNISNYADGSRFTDDRPQGRLETEATRVQPPGISQSILAPVDGVNNRRCQEWTTEYVHHLVQRGLINQSAIDIIQSKRDPPTHGIGLRPVQQAEPANPQQAGPANQSARSGSQADAQNSGGWVWDTTQRRYRRWNGTQWEWAPAN